MAFVHRQVSRSEFSSINGILPLYHMEDQKKSARTLDTQVHEALKGVYKKNTKIQFVVTWGILLFI